MTPMTPSGLIAINPIASVDARRIGRRVKQVRVSALVLLPTLSISARLTLRRWLRLLNLHHCLLC